MYSLEVKSARLGPAIKPDAQGVYNLKKNTAYRITIFTADTYLRLSNDRSTLGALAGWAVSKDVDIYMSVGVHFIDVGPRGFGQIKIPANANVVEIERI